MPHLRLYYHIVFVTHKRFPTIPAACERTLFAYIVKVSESKGVKVIRINGMADHVHLLIRARAGFVLQDYVRDVKRSATLMMRRTPGFECFDRWSKEYSADTVSFSKVDVVMNYIRNQKVHHAVKSFEEEIREIFNLDDISVYDA